MGKGFMGKGQQQQQITVDVNSLPVIQCECGNTVFRNGFELRLVSRLVSPTGKPDVIPVPIPICSACNKPVVIDLEKISSEHTKRQLAGRGADDHGLA